MDESWLGGHSSLLTEQANGAQDIGYNQWLEDVQLEMSIGAADSDSHLIAHHLSGEHGE